MLTINFLLSSNLFISKTASTDSDQRSFIVLIGFVQQGEKKHGHRWRCSQSAEKSFERGELPKESGENVHRERQQLRENYAQTSENFMFVLIN